MQGNDSDGLRGFHLACQAKMMANVQEITGLLSHLHCKDHPYVIVPIITGSASGAMHNPYFVCCSGCKEIITFKYLVQSAGKAARAARRPVWLFPQVQNCFRISPLRWIGITRRTPLNPLDYGTER